MAESLLEMENQLLPGVLTVHDEAITEVSKNRGTAALLLMKTIMSTTPKWAPGLPVAAEGWVGPRYKKG